MDPITILMLAVLAVLIFFMFRNSRKRQRTAAELQNQMVEGAEVMTNFGVYGKILEINEADNMVLLETTPGTVLRLHRQTLARVVTPEAVVVDDASVQPLDSTSGTLDDADPAYGERDATHSSTKSTEKTDN